MRRWSRDYRTDISGMIRAQSDAEPAAGALHPDTATTAVAAARRHGLMTDTVVGAGTVVVAAAVRLALDVTVGTEAQYLPFAIAVLISSWYGGLRAGLIAAVPGAAVAAFVFMDAATIGLGVQLFWLAAFLGTGVLIAAACESLGRARTTSTQQPVDTRATHERLEIALRARRRAEAGYLQLLHSNIVGVGVAEAGGEWIELNDLLLQAIGTTRAEAIGRHWIDFIDIGDDGRHQLRHELDETGSCVPFELAFTRTDGVTGTALLHINRAPETGDIVVFALDVTAQKHFESALAEIDRRYELLVESITDYAIVMLDPAGYVVSWNPGAERIEGYTADEIIGEHFSILYPAEERRTGRPEEALHCAARDGRWEDEGIRVRKDGSRYWANAIIAPVHLDGELRGFAKVVRDLTLRRAAEVLLKSVLDSATDGIIGIDEQGTIRSCNGAFERMFVCAASDVVGHAADELMPAWNQPDMPVHDGTQPVRPGRQLTGRRHDGSTFPLELTLSAFELDGQRFYTGVVRDLTGQRVLEEQLQQVQKMQAIGQLAGGVAHDFNNLLTIIAGHTELLLARPGNDTGLQSALGEIRDAGQRAAGLTRQLLAFSRRAVLEPKVLDLNSVVTDAERMLARLIGEDVELVTTLGDGLRAVNVDQGQIGQVLINLAVNARDSMPSGGRIEIITANVTFTADDLDRHPEATPGSYVALIVKDQGAGMTQETVSRIFEPFFSTKEAGAGTGLGLSMVYGIVKQSGGFIEVHSVPGSGSEFRVYLPATEPRGRPAPKRRDEALLHGDETLLVVEDEEQVRRLAVLSLRAHGYTVLEAGHGREALRILAEHDGRVDMVVTDVVMPVMGGRQLVEALRPVHGHIRVLYVSGYTDDAVIRHGVQSADAAFLQKPYTPQALAAKVRRVLDGG